MYMAAGGDVFPDHIRQDSLGIKPGDFGQDAGLRGREKETNPLMSLPSITVLR